MPWSMFLGTHLGTSLADRRSVWSPVQVLLRVALSLPPKPGQALSSMQLQYPSWSPHVIATASWAMEAFFEVRPLCIKSRLFVLFARWALPRWVLRASCALMCFLRVSSFAIQHIACKPIHARENL